MSFRRDSVTYNKMLKSISAEIFVKMEKGKGVAMKTCKVTQFTYNITVVIDDLEVPSI